MKKLRRKYGGGIWGRRTTDKAGKGNREALESTVLQDLEARGTGKRLADEASVRVDRWKE